MYEIVMMKERIPKHIYVAPNLKTKALLPPPRKNYYGPSYLIRANTLELRA